MTLTTQEINFLRGARAAAFCAAQREAYLLEKVTPAQPDPLASHIGAVRVLQSGQDWPTHDDTPMAPLIQLRISDIPRPPKPLAGCSYITVWCAISEWPKFEGDLQLKFLELGMSGNAKKIARFVKKYRNQMTIEREPELDTVHVQIVPAGSDILRAECPPAANIFKPTQVKASPATDHPDRADQIDLEFMPPETRARAEALYEQCDWNEPWLDEVPRLAPNLRGSKVGGWPAAIQGQPEFGDDGHLVLQIASDETIGMQFGDEGVFMLGYDPYEGEWIPEWTCY